MRILHVIPGLTRERGGPTAVVEALSRQQAAAGHTVTVLTTDQGLRHGEQDAEHVRGGYSAVLQGRAVRGRLSTGSAEAASEPEALPVHQHGDPVGQARADAVCLRLRDASCLDRGFEPDLDARLAPTARASSCPAHGL